MQSRIKISITLLIFVLFISIASIGIVQDAVAAPGETASEAKVARTPSFPYIAEAIANGVDVRSGPGTDYYRCGKLNKADQVRVIASKYSWSHIAPPAGSFSWVSLRHVVLDPQDPSTGIVKSETVRVYAGSEERIPIRSTTVQLKLNKGDKVKLIGSPSNDYYKIAPPTGAYLWVSSKDITPVDATSVKKAPKPTPTTTPKTTPVPAPTVALTPQTKPKTDIPMVVPTKVSVKSEKLDEYYALEKKIRLEQTKPIDQQNYAEIKKSLIEVAGDKEAGKAARYAELAVKQIDRIELALAVSKEFELQEEQSKQTRERIDKAHATRLAQLQGLGRFAAVGKFKMSKIFGAEAEVRRYRIVDNADKAVCYALPADQNAKQDLSKFIDKKVGLVGKIEPYPSVGGAMVRFTEIVELK